MPRPPKRPSSPQVSLGNGRGGNEGTSYGWIAYDHRSFGEMISDWQQSVSPGDVAGFLRSLHLDRTITPSHFIELVAGNSVPSSELGNYLAACVPPSVTSWRIMHNRANSALTRANGKAIIAPGDAVLAAREAKLREIAQSPAAQRENLTLASWRDTLLDRLAALIPGKPLDIRRTFDSMANYLDISPKVFTGEITLPVNKADSVASELAQLLNVAEADFDAFVEESTAALASPPTAAATVSNNFGSALRFLRQANGLPLTDATLNVFCSHRSDMAILEQGLVPTLSILNRLVNVLAHSPAESEILHTLAKASPPFETANIEGVVRHFARDGLTKSDYLRAVSKQPELHYQKPSTLIANIEGVVQHFAGDGLTKADYLRAATKHPQLFPQKPSTLIANIEGVVRHFARDGLTRADYLRAATRHPPLFSQKPSTLIANIEGVVRHFAGDGLTRADYLRATTRQPSLFSLKPSTLIANIEGVVRHFAGDGLTKADYLRAATKQPTLYYQKPSTLIANIEGVVNHFARDGLTKADYLRAVASKHPSLFTQKPSTLIANIEGVVSHFAADGLTKADYLRAATKQPQLFSQKPTTIIGHIHLLDSMHRNGLLNIPEGKRSLFDFVASNPTLLCLADNNLHLREIAAQVTDRHTTRLARAKIETIIREALSIDQQRDPTQSVDLRQVDQGTHARKLLLHALTKEGYFKGK